MTPDIMSGFEAYLSGSPVMAYVMAYVSGLVVSLTPCIYPMIPVTVAFISGQSAGSKSRGLILSVFYVLGTSLTYTVLGSVAALTGQFFGSIQTNPWTYLFMANICIIMGLSMLDVFTLSFPQLMSFGGGNPKKGYLGSFMIGAAFGLALGPCTAPVLGVLLSYVATKQNLLFGMSLLFVFSFGMGTLLLFLGSFSALMSNIPKAGPWMVKVQKASGILLIAMGEYFLIKSGQLMI